MKKFLALLLSLLLLACPALAEPAAEESAPMTHEELEVYLSYLAENALKDENRGIITSKDGPTTVTFLGGTLAIADEAFTKSSAILGAELDVFQADHRGLQAGDSLEALLAAYPNDNPGLYGSYYDAALYVSGEMPEATAGWLLRDGQRVTEVVHGVFHWVPEGVVFCGVRYELEANVIASISIFGMENVISQQDAQTQLLEVTDMQEVREYYAFPQSTDGASLRPFEREDLTVAGLDFLDLTAESATKKLGASPVDEWTKDSTGEYLRLKQWDGLTLNFVYDANKKFLRVDSAIINGDQFEGPRGVRVGDPMDTVMYRFRHGEGTQTENGITLYGDGQNAPYGILAYGEETASLTYTLSLDQERTVIWHMTFMDGLLQSMRMLMR